MATFRPAWRARRIAPPRPAIHLSERGGDSLDHPYNPAVESRGVAASSVSHAERALLIAFPAVKMALHLLVGRGYGYHRDELYSSGAALRTG
jgi:hypothetical protein